MKTVKQWLEELPEPIRTQAFENVEKQNRGDVLKNVLYHEFNLFKRALNTAFIWGNSNEGYEFWNKVSLSYIPISSNTPQTIIQTVEQWGRDRNIIQSCPPIKQAYKTLEECGELIEAIASGDFYDIADAIGDIQVTLILQCAMQGLDYNECLEKAYEVIKDRKGKLIGGKFVKEEV